MNAFIPNDQPATSASLCHCSLSSLIRVFLLALFDVRRDENCSVWVWLRWTCAGGAAVRSPLLGDSS